MPDPQMTAFLHGVVGVVEATRFEHHALWRLNDLDGRHKWESATAGLGEIIGKVGKMPVAISLNVDVIDGHRILFYHATSQVVDHRMVEAWLEKNLPVTAFMDSDPRKRMNHSDSINFPNVLPRQKLAA